MIYGEDQLESSSLCALRTASPTADNRHWKPAQNLLSWALLRSFEGTVLTLPELREKYIGLWKSVYYPQYKGVTPPDEDLKYWEGPRKASALARRLRQFLSVSQVIHPLQPYGLAIAGNQITGAYALLTRRSGTGILLNYPHAPGYGKYPGVKLLCRWLHARRQHEYKDILGFHLPLLRSRLWESQSLDERLAERWLRSILETRASTLHPAPGAHCTGCATQGCLEIFRG